MERVEREHSEISVSHIKKGPFVDYSYQFNMARERAEKKVYNMLCELSTELHKEKRKVGALIVLGVFDKYPEHAVPGMRQIGANPIQKYLNVAFGQFEADIKKILESGDDGAIVINHNGQILGTGIYLTVDNPILEIPDGAGTRHISAASFSTRDDVIATFTLSEETLTVRMWKDGSFTEQHRPDEDTE